MTARCMRISSTARRASASRRRRSRSPLTCWVTAAVWSAGRIPISTCSSRSAIRSASTRCGGCCGLHMRPFEAERRVYLLVSAHSLNEEAADALLKDLEEPPPYAVLILLADELGPLPETIRSRCQLVPFSRLSEKAVHDAGRAGAGSRRRIASTALARVAGGRLDRAERLLDEDAAARREELLALARGVHADPSFEPSSAAASVVADGGDGLARGTGRGGAGGGVARPARPRARPVAAPRGVRGQPGERARGAGRADGVVPRPRRRSPSAPRRSSRTSIISTRCATMERSNAFPARRGRRRSCASRGAGSRLNLQPGWRSRRSSCGSAASCSCLMRARYPSSTPT